MADEPSQQPPDQPTVPSAEIPEEKKEEPATAEQPPEQIQEQQQPEQQKEEVSAETSQPKEPKLENTSITESTSAELQPASSQASKSTPEQSELEEPKPTEDQEIAEVRPSENKPDEGPQSSHEQSLKSPEPGTKTVNVEEQIQERLKEEQGKRRKLANEARAERKSDNLERLLKFAKDKSVITNNDARDFLHISQSTATNYLTELVVRGSLKRKGERGGTRYSA